MTSLQDTRLPEGQTEPRASDDKQARAVSPTPGPWHYNSHDEQQQYAGNISSDLGRNEAGIMRIRTIAVAMKYCGKEEADANGHLISAAPELLAALQCALFDLEHTYSHVSSVSADRIKSETIPLCRAVIAKATAR